MCKYLVAFLKEYCLLGTQKKILLMVTIVRTSNVTAFFKFESNIKHGNKLKYVSSRLLLISSI